MGQALQFTLTVRLSAAISLRRGGANQSAGCPLFTRRASQGYPRPPVQEDREKQARHRMADLIVVVSIAIRHDWPPPRKQSIATSIRSLKGHRSRFSFRRPQCQSFLD
jgi:hypothetical protein